MRIPKSPTIWARVLLRLSAIVIPAIVGTATFAQQVTDLTPLGPVTFPVRVVHRDPNAVAPTCPAPPTTSVSALTDSSGEHPVVYPRAVGPAVVHSAADLPDKRARSMANPRASATSSPQSVLLAAAVITGSAPADCTTPTAKVQFSPTDQGNIYSFITVNGANNGDAVRWEWYAPDNSLAFTASLNLQVSGSVCFWAWIQVSDAAPHPGNWTVKVFYQNSPLTTLTFSITGNQQQFGGGCSSISGKVCRDEISLFYQGAHSLGTAWPRAVFEPTFPGALAIAQIQGSLDNLVAGLKATPCIPYDLTKITALRDAIPTLPSATIVSKIGALIPDIQLAIRSAALPCDGGANFEALYVVGVNLGASIAEAIGFMYSDPLSAPAIAFITSELTAASAAMSLYVPCANNFTPVMLAAGNFDLTNPRVLVPLTQMIGTYNLIVWNISLSCCCCTCSGSGNPSTGDSKTGIITGVVRNATNGSTLSGVTVIVKGTGLTTQSGSDGTFKLTNVPAGAQTLQASLQGFVTSSVSVSVPAGQTVTQNLSLSPVLQTAGEFRITLNWTRSNSVPDDLDMHLIVPQSDGTCYEVYYANQGASDTVPFAQLEADNIDVTGDPPLETIHIAKLAPGTYTLYINHYSSAYGEPSNAMAASRATVQVFTQAGTVFSQVVPSSSGVNWDVLRINGSTGAITATNTVSNSQPSSSCH